MKRGFWKGLLTVCLVMLLVLAGSILLVEPDSATWIIIQLAAIHLVVAILIIGSFLYFDWNPIENLVR